MRLPRPPWKHAAASSGPCGPIINLKWVLILFKKKVQDGDFCRWKSHQPLTGVRGRPPYRPGLGLLLQRVRGTPVHAGLSVVPNTSRSHLLFLTLLQHSTSGTPAGNASGNPPPPQPSPRPAPPGFTAWGLEGDCRSMQWRLPHGHPLGPGLAGRTPPPLLPRVHPQASMNSFLCNLKFSLSCYQRALTDRIVCPLLLSPDTTQHTLSQHLT